MSTQGDHGDAGLSGAFALIGTAGISPRRCLGWSGAPPEPALPSAGGDFDGVIGPITLHELNGR